MSDPIWRRRQLLRASAVAVGGAGVGWSAGAAVASATGSSSPAEAPARTATGTTSLGPEPGAALVPFHGPHQAGVTTPPQAHLSLLGLDLRRGVDRADLGRLLGLLSDDARRLSVGLPALADSEPELAARPARLTVTLGLGPSVMTDLLGRRGVLAPLPAFRTDRLREEWGQTDLVVQVCCDDPITLAHARRMLLKDAAAFVRVRWIQDGFRRGAGMDTAGASMRNVMGQVDGTGNPQETDADFASLVWSQRAGLEGATTMVVRRIRTLLDTWDAVDRVGREAVIGRRLDTGAPLTGQREEDPLDLDAVDDLGLPVTDPASHVARAHSSDPRQRFLRRPYNYVVPDASRPTGEDAGLVFVAFCADAARQFVPVQRRLAEQDRLNQWTSAIGSGVYLVPPGAAEGEAVGARLLT